MQFLPIFISESMREEVFPSVYVQCTRQWQTWKKDALGCLRLTVVVQAAAFVRIALKLINYTIYLFKN